MVVGVVDCLRSRLQLGATEIFLCWLQLAGFVQSIRGKTVTCDFAYAQALVHLVSSIGWSPKVGSRLSVKKFSDKIVTVGARSADLKLDLRKSLPKVGDKISSVSCLID